MRLLDKEKSAIVQAVKMADPDAEIYLFGSRADDTKKGGDIDVLVFSTKISYRDKLEIKARIFENIEEQKIDLLIAGDKRDPFVRSAFENSVKLK